jgi:hypothetical protein
VKHPSRLEKLVEKKTHFGTIYHTKMFFSDENNLTPDLKGIVKDLLELPEKQASKCET